VIEAFIFDMDGTLMDSEIIWVRAVEDFLESRGQGIEHDDAIRLVYGRSFGSIYGDIVRLYPGIDEGILKMEKDLRESFRRLGGTADAGIASSVGLLKKLSLKYPVCIVSGSPREDLDYSIRFLGIENDIAFSLASEDYSPGKPHPACFLLAACKLGKPPERCLVFEDSAAGVRAAATAGMACVALSRKGMPVQDVSSADEVLEDLAGFDASKWTG
jgi:beta-phosphoglucomutase-like phosphatase (HAD superfamily)